MTTAIGHQTRKKLLPDCWWTSYCLKRYKKESRDPTFDSVSGVAEPCPLCRHMTDEWAKRCKQMDDQCPTCGRTTRRYGRCSDNWHSGNCGTVYY